MATNSIKQDEQISTTPKRVTLARLFRYMLKYKGKIVIVLLLMGINIAVGLANPLIIEHAINVNIAGKDWDGLIKLGIVAVLINLAMIFVMKLRMWIMAKISNDVLLTIRQELYEHLQLLSLRFFDSRPTGKILARVIGDVNSLKQVLSDAVTTLIPDLLTVIAVVVIMVVKNPLLALSALCSLPILIVFMSFIQTVSHKRWQIFRKKGSNLNAFVHEDVSGIRVVQSFAAEDESDESYKELVGEHFDAFISAVKVNDLFGFAINICWGIGALAVYLVGVKIVGAEIAPIGTLTAFVAYIDMFWQPISNLSNFYNQVVTNISGAERVFEIMDQDPEIKDAENAQVLPEIKGDVRFSNVSFHYDDDPDVLSNVSFHVKPGMTVALVGPTGAGKTTIVNLISRFYDVQKGSVLVDNYDIKDVTIESLRSQMGIMTQDNFLFSGTIRENIRYGKLDATDEEIEAAAKAVHAHDFIMKLEKGYDTELKERGAGLSNGQRQLLAFARTMVSDPRILILDEATSSIDTHTELIVQSGIEALLKGRTSFIIAHRLSTIRNADRICYVDKGGILEAGTPEELLAKKGYYYDLYMASLKNVG